MVIPHARFTYAAEGSVRDGGVEEDVVDGYTARDCV